jgi:hypothetical protein
LQEQHAKTALKSGYGRSTPPRFSSDQKVPVQRVASSHRGKQPDCMILFSTLDRKHTRPQYVNVVGHQANLLYTIVPQDLQRF